jgi:hypothetical protein
VRPFKLSRIRVTRILSSFVISALVLLSNSELANAAYPYASTPKDVEAIKSKIADSLVLVKYGATPQIAFSASYDITQSLKDQGTYSILVTPESLISNCFRTPYDLRRLGLNLEYKGKAYKGTCYGWGIDYVDMANIHTTVAIPQLSLWDSYWPQIGGWLIAVYYLPNYGITFQETRVGIVDKTKYIIGIEKFASPPSDGTALIFNQDASFVGIMTNKSYGSVPNQYFKVHGAPLQCDLQGNDGNSLTRCNGTRKSVNESAQAGVWIIDSASAPLPTPKPTPTPSTTPRDSSKEGRDAYDSAVEVYNQFKKSKVTCLDSFRAKTISEKNVVNLVDFNAICSSEDNKVESIYRTLTALRNSASSPTVTTSTIDRINRMNDEMQDAIEVVSIGSSFGNALLSSHQTYTELVMSINSFNSSVKTIENMLVKFPPRLRANLVDSDNFFEYREFKLEFSEINEELISLRRDFSEIDALDSSYNVLIESIENLARTIPRSAIVDRAVKRAKESIPNSYCKKGTTLSLPKSNKCNSGYSRVIIK